MIKNIFILCSVATLMACQETKVIDNSPAGIIITECINTHGGDRYNTAFYVFDFRDKTYVFDYNHGVYAYERVYKHEKGNIIRDILTNEGLKRTIDGRTVALSEEKNSAYSQSVNSVHYFAFLPFFLQDPAVKKELLEEEVIRGKNYHKIRVTFSETQGGNDHEDVYVYWIQKDNHSMDYLAYSYDNPEDKGVRFRAAYNPRIVEDIRFQDYINYKHDAATPVHQLGHLYDTGQLIEISRIELKNIKALKRTEK